MQEIKGFVSNIIYRNEENGYTVFEVETASGDETCTGVVASLSVGESCALEGEFAENPKYGRQFRVTAYRSAPPEGVDAIRRYLASGAVKGIKEALAERIVRKFGEDTLRIMEEEPERLAEIKGISLNKAREISAQMEDRRDLRDAMLFLARYGIGNAMALRIWQTYGMGVYQIMKENPYRLAEDVDGIGFPTADAIAVRAGIRVDSDYRVRCGILHVLGETLAEGSTYLPRPQLTSRAAKLLALPEETADIQLDNLIMERKAAAYRPPAAEGEAETGELRIYSAPAAIEEQQIARMLLDLDGDPLEKLLNEKERTERIAELEHREGITLDDLQREAVKKASEHAVFILTGGPGTGKTTTINTIIRFFLSLNMEVMLAAPTGRAARRMTEATGFEARTIHRLLGVKSLDEEDGRRPGASGRSGRAVFDRNRDNPLDADVVIIDEMSMVDMHLFCALLKALMPGTRLILSGDVNQLPCVGPGRVLQDMLDSGQFHSVSLKKIFRQASESDIVMNAHRVIEGEAPSLSNKSRDFFFLERSEVPVIYKHTVELIRDRLPGYVKCSASEIQVLTPMRRGPLGVERLNEVLQSTLNPASPKKRELVRGEKLFREGDKVMQAKNNYQLPWEVRGRYGIAIDKGEGVFNGDFGTVESINEAAELMTVRFDDDRVVDYPFSELADLELAYAVTVHKSQGSEYPAVILPLLSGPPALFNRNLLYTAITRAKNCVVILGSRETVRQMTANEKSAVRYTGLADRIADFARMDRTADIGKGLLNRVSRRDRHRKRGGREKNSQP